jgi:hypothetical protein
MGAEVQGVEQRNRGAAAGSGVRRVTARTASAAAGLAYLAAWLVGLALPEAAVSAGDSPASAMAGSVVVFWRSLLVHGLAGLALLPVAWEHYRRARLRFLPYGRILLAAAMAAAILSLAQCLVEVALVGVFGSPGSGAVDAMWRGVNAADGLKMLCLALWITVAALSVRGGSVLLPRWLRAVSPLAVLSLVLSGCGYLLSAAPLMKVAYVSLPLLLVWVAAAALSAGRGRVDPGR